MLCLVAFLFTGAIEFAAFIPHTNHDVQVLNCFSLGMAGSVTCKTTPFDTSWYWNVLFVYSFAVSVLTAAYTLFANALLLILFYRQRRRSREILSMRTLQEAFSQGILNPRLFK
jgi:hypothetical protein